MTNSPNAPDRIMVDGFSLSLTHGTGIATYARNLLHALQANGQKVGILHGRPVANNAPSLVKEVTLYDYMDERPTSLLRQTSLNLARLTAPTLTYTASPVPLTGAVIDAQMRNRVPAGIDAWNVHSLYEKAERQFAIWNQFTTVRLPNPPRVMHWTYPLPIRMEGSKNIYTLHDLVPLRLPYTTLDNKRRYYRLVKKIADTADHIVTVSECSKRDIMSLLGVPENKITNTYQSVHIPDHLLKRTDEEIAAEIENIYGLPFRGYFIFYGAFEPKKNVTRLVHAYLASGVSAPLVMVGPDAWGTETKLLAKEIEAGAYGNRIRRMKYVPFETLVSLIRGAKATLFPSLYEGFGLPVLESMMLGTPVLSSNVSSIPEVAGDRALLVDPYSTSEIRDAIRALDSDEGLQSELTLKGGERAVTIRMVNYENLLRQVQLT
jgi:glycosyltransferase involved in cell wall biosynthesis